MAASVTSARDLPSPENKITSGINATQDNLAQPEHLRVDNRPCSRNKALEPRGVGDIQVREVIDGNEIEHRGDEHAEAGLLRRPNTTVAKFPGPSQRMPAMSTTRKSRKTELEGHDDEHGRDDRRVIGFTRHQETEDGAGTRW